MRISLNITRNEVSNKYSFVKWKEVMELIINKVVCDRCGKDITKMDVYSMSVKRKKPNNVAKDFATSSLGFMDFCENCCNTLVQAICAGRIDKNEVIIDERKILDSIPQIKQETEQNEEQVIQEAENQYDPDPIPEEPPQKKKKIDWEQAIVLKMQGMKDSTIAQKIGSTEKTVGFMMWKFRKEGRI